MKEIEEYIRNNSELFNEEPSEAHLEYFEQKLQERKISKRHRMIRSTVRVASVAILLVMSGLYISNRFWDDETAPVQASQEFMEAQFYYTTQISDGINMIRSIGGVLSDEQRALLVEEMSEVDTLFEELQIDLQATPNDSRVIEAMLNHYRVKAMIINDIVNDLEKINDTQKDKGYENAEI